MIRDTLPKPPYTCPRCGGQLVRPGTYTGVCWACFERRRIEAIDSGVTGELVVVQVHSEQGATEDNPCPLPRMG